MGRIKLNSRALNRLYDTCLTKGKEDVITAEIVEEYCISPFMVYCEKFVPPEMKNIIPGYEQLLAEQGKVHERLVKDEKYPGAKLIAIKNYEEGFKQVLEGMRDGKMALLNAPIFYLPEGLMGVADILEKKNTAPSIFGNYHYVVKEIKMAKNVKSKHILQASFYNYLIGKIQGYTPDIFFLINQEHEEFPQKYDENSLLENLSEIRAIMNGKNVTPTYGACDGTPWETYTNDQAIKLKDVSLVSGCGPVLKEKLREKGIETFEQLAMTPKERLASIKGIGNKRALKLIYNSKALALGKHIRIGNFDKFPSKTTEIFLDLEGTGEQFNEGEIISVDYLIGVLVRKNGHTVYKSFFAETPEKERTMFIKFANWVNTQEDFIIYHWHNYERTHLQRMAKRYGLSLAKINLIFSNMRDIWKDATSTFAFPTYGNSLKDIARYIGYKWKHQEVNALESIAIYLNYIRDKNANREMMQKVIDYNKDDCEATLLVKDWLEKEVRKSHGILLPEAF